MVGGPKVSFEDQEYSGISRVLSKIYSRFIQVCCTPYLSKRKGVDFHWGPEQQAAFDTLRHKLFEALVLTLPQDVEDFLCIVMHPSPVWG